MPAPKARRAFRARMQRYAMPALAKPGALDTTEALGALHVARLASAFMPKKTGSETSSRMTPHITASPPAP